MTRRLDDGDVRRWVRRLERVLADIPVGVTLHGMDDSLLIVDVAAFEADCPGGDLTKVCYAPIGRRETGRWICRRVHPRAVMSTRSCPR